MELKLLQPGEETALFDARMETPELVSLGCGLVAYFSTRSPDKEGANEDSAYFKRVRDSSVVLAVADGVGGEKSGQEASKQAITCIKKTIAKAEKPTELRELILDGFEEANRVILAMNSGSASTLAVVEIHAGEARTYHAGDTSISIVGNQGKIKFQTISHAPVAYGVEHGFIDEKLAMFHEQRHVISNYVGSQEMSIEIGPVVPLSMRDTILLASDGLSDNLTGQEMLGFVRKGPLKKVCPQLADECRKRMSSESATKPSKPDDLTFLVFRQR